MERDLQISKKKIPHWLVKLKKKNLIVSSGNEDLGNKDSHTQLATM